MTWISDGSPELSIDGSQVSCRTEPNAGSNVYNVLWKEGISQGKGYWRVSVHEGNGLFVGVTDESKFKKGWGCKGLLYGGNLSNGGALLLSDFGPWIKAGDTVGIFTDIDDSKIHVYFDINGRPLGQAFNVGRNTLGQMVFPIIHFSEAGGVAKIEKSDAFPSTVRQDEAFDGIEGDWKYTSGPFSSQHGNITLGIRRLDPNSYKGTLHVINTIGVTIARSGPNEAFQGTTGFSTLMAGPPEQMEVENGMTQHMNAGTFELNEAGQLKVMKGDAVTLWTRHSESKEPISQNPFA